MKNANFTLKAAIYLILVAMLVWLGLYWVQTTLDPYSTAVVNTLKQWDTVSLNGIVVREERVLETELSSVQVRLEEGARVSRGGLVAEGFDSPQSLIHAVHEEELEAEMAQLYAQLEGLESRSRQDADRAVQQAAQALETQVLRQELSAAQSGAAALQALVFASSSSVTQIQTRIHSCQTALSDLRAQGVRGTSRITAPVSGLYSAAVDGWEDLNADALEMIEPAALAALLQEKREPSAHALGKLVSGSRWYYAALLSEADGEKLRGLTRVSIRFGRYFGAEITMDVEWLSARSDGKQALLLSSSRELDSVLSLRQQSAELVLNQETGLQIPRRALHVDEAGHAFVYVQTGRQVEKKQVKVVKDLGDSYMVTSDSLKEGNLVIVAAKGLYAGKVVRE